MRKLIKINSDPSKLLDAEKLRNSMLEQYKLLNTAATAEKLDKMIIKSLNDVYQSFGRMDQNLYHIKAKAEELKDPKMEE
jgi:hypothetical protein